MKIDNDQANFDPSVKGARPDAVRNTSGHKAGKTGAAGGQDTVKVSAAAQFASRAISTSQQTSAVRPDVVARAKQLLADGKIGNDPQRLADKLIDLAIDSDE